MCGFKVGSRLRCLLKWWWILQWLTSGQDRCPNIAPAWAGEPVLSVRCGPGPLGPWTLLWTTVACLRQKGEWVGWGGGEAVLSVRCGPGPLGPWTLLWTTVACLRQVSGGGGGGGLEKLFYQYSVGLALWTHEHSYEWLWPVCARKVSGQVFLGGGWCGGGGESGGGGGGEAVLSVWHGHGPLGPWILLWMTVACLWQKGEWTVGVEEGGWGWGSVSMVWTWPSRLCY